MDKKIRIKWGTIATRGSGNQYGYFTHNTKLKEAVGEQIELISDNPTDIIYITSPEYFEGRVKGVRTWLFTMFEGTTIPERYQEQMVKADCLLAPSTWVKELFRQYFSEKPIYVIPHGVSKDFRYKKKYFPNNKPFRYLWVGAPNPRKGYEEVIIVWKEIFQKHRGLELYIKTTGPDNWNLNGKVQRKGNVILDARKLTVKELVKLYHSAHCFLFPTRGEGFGLTLAEAMRTGLPCISTYYSGVTDFFDSKVGYIIEHKMGKGKITFIGDDYEEETEMAFPLPDQLAEKMMHVLDNYSEALKFGKRASKRIELFTWYRSGRKLIKVIQGMGGIDG